MTQPAKAQEPSMEEILASIRRIISDDDTASKAPAIPPKAAPAAPLRAEAPPRPAPAPTPVPASVAPPPKPVSPASRDRVATHKDIESEFGEPGQPAIELMPKAAEADILELTEEMAAEPPAPASMQEPAAQSFRTIDGQPDVFFAENPVEAEPKFDPEPAQPLPSEEALAPFGFDNLATRSIMSQATSAAVDSAFNQLAQSVFTQNGRTIEDLVRDMMRPMLKSWLDDNLPGLVERLVRAEIERVSRGR